MRLLLIIAVTFILTGCGEQFYYTKKEVSAEKMAADMFECLLKIGSTNSPQSQHARMEQLCMKSKGYQVHHGKTPQDVEDIIKN